ncbi:MAG TPA: threonine/homoserine exporter RhtA [Longimicrobium sp.]|nr:threonine/homoserine exporter RhtA [Longimicrobium sp.]
MQTNETSRASSTLVPIALLVIAMPSIQSGAALAKQLFPVVGATGAVSLRLSFAAVILVAILRPWRVRMSAADWRSVAAYGAALAGMTGLFYSALRTVPLGIATALEFTGPLFVAMLASRRPLDFAWIGLAVAGLLLLLPLGVTSTSLDPVGVGFALGAGACWALYIVFGQKAGAEHGVQVTAWGVTIAAVCMLPVGIATAGSALLTPRVIPIALAVAVLSTAFPYALEMVGLSRLPKKTFGTLMSLEPAVASLSGLVFLGERLAPVQWLAIVAIITASVGTTVTTVRAHDPVTFSDPPVLE